MPVGATDAVSEAVDPDPFLVLPENRFAHSALTHWDPDPEKPIPAVYVYGPSGAGKSHLIRAALGQYHAQETATRTLVLTGAEFFARASEAAETRDFRSFRRQFQKLQVLVIEDLAGLTRRVEPQQQLTALWDDLVAHQCRIIVSSRTSAGEVPQLIPELVNRCHGAIMVPVRLPSPSSRERLLNHWARQSGVLLDTSVTTFLRDTYAVSPRELRGVLTQLAGLTRQRRQPLEVEVVRRHLLGQHPHRVYSPAEIAKCVARHFQVTLADLRAKSRKPSLVLPRQCAMVLIRELTDQSLQKIGTYFGGRDHTTVLHACQKLNQLLPDQPGLRQDLAKIRNQLQVPDQDPRSALAMAAES